MRVLFLTNFFLVNSGGEEQSCQQVVENLTQRGHSTLVLTSMHGTDNRPVEEGGVYQSLYLEMDLVPFRNSVTFFTERKAREHHNLQVFERVLQQFEPDIIFIWGMWNLHYSLAAYAEARYPDKVVYRFATYWPTLPSQHELYWRKAGRTWYSGLVKGALSHIALAMLAKEQQRRRPLAFKHAICVSAATRKELVEAGVPVSHSRIIHTGLDVQRYISIDEHYSMSPDEPSLHLLYAGRLNAEKGIDTLIEALVRLVNVQGKQAVTLSLAGTGSIEYENQLQQRVNEAGLDNHVTFLGWVPQPEMPGLLRKFDVLLLPSIWPEPFSRAVLEGMISGLVVVAARTGGTPEIIVDGENGLMFVPNNPEDLATKIAYLMDNPAARIRIGSAGRQTILERFTMTRMMNEIEGYLQEVAYDSSSEEINQLESVRGVR